MRKLSLDIDTLRVESFLTAATPAKRGTVHANRAIWGDSDPVAYTECTDGCMSGESQCPILSCGSSCDPDQPVGITG